MTPAGVDVRVTREADGVIRVAAGPAGPTVARAVLDVAGAVLSWPVLGGSGPPVAEIHDPARAQQWLWALYGERVAAAVHAAAAGEPTDLPTPAEPTELAGAAARLGLGHWAARWWPASQLDGIPALEADVLGLELAALTHRCQQLFDDGDDQPDDCAAELIEEHRGAIDPLIRWWRAAAGPENQLERVLRLLADAADRTGLEGPELRRLEAALDRPEPVPQPVDVGPLFARHGDHALAAGHPGDAGGRVIARGAATNDWRRYPPGLVDAAEHAVTWTARALGARRLIEVEAVAAPTGGAFLAAEVRVDGGEAARLPLARRDDLWTGRADLDLRAAATPPRIDVDVLLPGFDPGPDASGDAEARDDRDDRHAIRALVRRRLAAAAQSPPYDAPLGPFLAEFAAATGDEDF
ncbi:hypothetical protein [Streptomyces hainanensis]|uniref:Uncharacterized protein n=1 Tax=Streptomyces hainanensis TaxID=402648 RepID=A0A4R4TM06_9ACTN|nr:hypothetical protein [Streptomyces hainanensis]TDC79098.1 hypothetical protein E1283_03620 [Streptomyces hainanensis]